MGSIRTRQIKIIAKGLIRRYPELFSNDFEKNKEALAEFDLKSKWMRNKVAGYITNLKAKENN
ncbi:MAG: 30S ribosomal protein S17e [Candidatus Aenigmatarchaeota archaeon]|nr:MAG: 30S ribosomal protein S17e [Candidatus Aenigmarchaeota archaeon]